MNTISILGGIAAMLLIIELLVAVLIVGAVIYFLRRGLIAGRQQAAPYVQQATEQIQRVEALTKEYSELIVGSQVEAISAVHGLRHGLRALLQEIRSGDENATSGARDA